MSESVAWERLPLDGYPHRETFQTRWADNDQYGHLNNTVHYAAVDSAVNRLLINASEFRPSTTEEIGLVVASSCRYYREAAYPSQLQLGLAVSRIGRSSVHYLGGMFRTGVAEPELIAIVQFSHAYVERKDRTTTPVPEYVLSVINPLLLTPALLDSLLPEDGKEP